MPRPAKTALAPKPSTAPRPHARVLPRLSTTSGEPLYKQLVQSLRNDILRGLFPVGSQLPVRVHVQTGASRSTLVARANVSLVIRSTAGSRVNSIRLKEQETNQLGDAYFNLAALQLPGSYTISVSVDKGELRGGTGGSVRVRRK